MACRLFGAETFREPVLTCFQLDTWEHTSVELQTFSLNKMGLKPSAVRWGHFVKVSSC